MAKKSLTIEDVKKAKIDLESAIAKLMQDFESTNGIKLGYLDVKRERKKSKGETKVMEEPYEPHKGKIETVEINMELDLMY